MNYFFLTNNLEFLRAGAVSLTEVKQIVSFA